MLVLTVASIIVSLQNVEGGYDYARPGTRLSLPNHQHWPGVQGLVGGRLNEYKKSEERKISYSLPYRNDDILQEHKNGKNINYFSNSFNTSPYQKENFDTYRDFNSVLTKSNNNIGTSNKIQSSGLESFIGNRPNRVYGSPNIVQSQTLTHHHQAPIAGYLQNGLRTDFSGIQEYNVNNVQQTLHRSVPNLMNANVASHLNLQNSLPSNVNFGPQLGVHFRKQPTFFNPQSIPNVLETHNQNIQTVAPLLNLQNDLLSQKTYTPQVNANSNPSLDNLNNLPQPIDGQNTPPIITKHIYFHAPPPDVEETSVEPTPPKKTYKIIFIKVPSQEPRKIEELQEAYNRLGPIEDKTLIYLLSNNSEDYSQLVPAYKPSEHEVLFVKYNENQSISSDGNLKEQDDGIYHKR